MRVVTDPKMSAAAAALNSISKGENWREARHANAGSSKLEDKASEAKQSKADQIGRVRGDSLPDPPMPEVTTVPSAPEIRPPSVKDASIATPSDPNYGMDHTAQLTLYTYKPSSQSQAASQPSPLPSTHSVKKTVASLVNFNYASLPWRIRYGDYLEIRRTDEEVARDSAKSSKPAETMAPPGAPEKVQPGGALKGVSRKYRRDGYIFRVGEDAPNVSVGQIQLPESVAIAFNMQHRSEVDIHRVSLGHTQWRSTDQ